jgi:hypothetical protein
MLAKIAFEFFDTAVDRSMTEQCLPRGKGVVAYVTPVRILRWSMDSQMVA